MLDELKELARLRVLSVLNKKRIVELSKEIGIAFYPKNTKCTNCYHDQIIILMSKLNNKKSNCKYRTKNESGYRFQGVLINNETLTNKLAIWFIKQSPKHKDLLVKIEENADTKGESAGN